jgi:hypothetical protein
LYFTRRRESVNVRGELISGREIPMLIRKALLNTTMLAGIVGGAVLAAGAANAADVAVPYYKAPVLPEPAVDGFNAKWEALGGRLAHRNLYGSRAAFSLPLATQWGLQVDVHGGSLEGRAFGTIAPHLFWRDPSRGLIGIYASHTHWDQFGGVHVTQVSGEGEAYFGRFTVQGIAGVEFGNSVTNIAQNVSIVPPAGGVFGAAGIATTNTFLEGFDVKTRSAFPWFESYQAASASL